MFVSECLSIWMTADSSPACIWVTVAAASKLCSTDRTLSAVTFPSPSRTGQSFIHLDIVYTYWYDAYYISWSKYNYTPVKIRKYIPLTRCKSLESRVIFCHILCIKASSRPCVFERMDIYKIDKVQRIRIFFLRYEYSNRIIEMISSLNTKIK